MASTIDRARNGSIGIFTRNSPIIVISYVFSSRHFSIFMTSIEFKRPYLLGGDRNGNFMIFLISNDFSRRTTVSRAIFWISGVLFLKKLFLSYRLYNRKQYPLFVRPALPARCFAEDSLIFCNLRVVTLCFWS